MHGLYSTRMWLNGEWVAQWKGISLRLLFRQNLLKLICKLTIHSKPKQTLSILIQLKSLMLVCLLKLTQNVVSDLIRLEITSHHLQQFTIRRLTKYLQATLNFQEPTTTETSVSPNLFNKWHHKLPGGISTPHKFQQILMQLTSSRRSQDLCKISFKSLRMKLSWSSRRNKILK